MNNADLKRFTEALGGTFEVYGKQVSPMLVNIWWAAMSKYSIQEFCTALTRHITDPDGGQYPPKPADIVRALSGSKDGQALVGWSKVMNAIKLIGSYQSVCFDDKLINHCIQTMGGWTSLCLLTEDDLKFKSNEFQKLYKSCVLNPPLSHPSHLIGLEESAARRGGYEIDPPRLIGDQEVAKLTYQTGKEGRTLQISSLSSVSSILSLVNKKDDAA